MRRLGIATALAAALVAAAPAGAAEVSATSGCDRRAGCIEYVSYFAEPGEANDVTLELRATEAVFREAAGALTARGGCALVSPSEARCRLREPSREYSRMLAVRAGDGDDVVRVTGLVASTIELGPGADRFEGVGRVLGQEGDDVLHATTRAWSDLDGGDGADRVLGGDGPDLLRGGFGRDELDGGAGDDRLALDDGEPDRAEGGRGRDLVTYTGITAANGVVVDLADQVGEGVPGEGDVVTGVEGAEGGYGPDRLAGDAGPNLLIGGRGRDEILGREGDDELRAAFDDPLHHDFESRDVLDAGPGDDLAVAAARDTVGCGDGRDDVRTEHMAVPTVTACERWSFRTGERQPLSVLAIPRRPAAGRVALRVPCPAQPRRRRNRQCFARASAGAGAASARIRRGRRARLAPRVGVRRPVTVMLRVREGPRRFVAGLRLPSFR
jgi:RTX calcium-binding nonapeptide repeat (4 copies)